MLPGSDGLAILRDVRANGDIPVILLTARAEEIDRIVGLELGADDYVVKPFSPRELAVRARNLLRRSARQPDGDGDCSSASLSIEPAAREVTVDGRVVALTPKEFDVLHLLARSPRQVFSRRQLLEQLWDSAPEFQDPATVTVHVGRLRQKLEADPEHPRWIVTAWGVGYRFEAMSVHRHDHRQAVGIDRRGRRPHRDVRRRRVRPACAHPPHPLAAPPRAGDHAELDWPSAPSPPCSSPG